jgi:hypothetical protein
MMMAATSWAPFPSLSSSADSALLDRVVALEGAGKGEDGDLTHQAAEQVEEARAAAKRHGAQGVAVIAAVEGDEYAPPRLAAIGPILEGDLQRHLHRGGAVVGEEDAGKVAGQEARKRGGEIDGRLMGEACKHHMREPVRLPGKRRVQIGMGVAMGAGPPGRDEVEDLASLGVEQRGPAGARDEKRLARRAMLGEGMPDMTLVAGENVAGDCVTSDCVTSDRVTRDLVVRRHVLHGSARASWTRSSSGSIASSASSVTVSSHGISAITRTWP